MKQQYFSIFALLLSLSLTTPALAALTFSADAITGTTASTIDVGAGNALNIQTVGSGAVNMGGNLVVAGTLEATGNLLTSSLPKDALTVQGGVLSWSPTSAGESAVFKTNTLWTHDGAVTVLEPTAFQSRIQGSGTATLYGLQSFTQSEPDATGTFTLVGGGFWTHSLGTNTGTIYGVRAHAVKAAGGVTANAFGVSSVVQTNGASVGTITSGRVFDAKVSALTTGTITSGYNFYGGGSSKAGTGAITSFANMALVDSTTATNNTNVLIGTATIPAGNFALYSADTDSSYFAGKVGIGSSTPVSPLRVVGLPVYANNAAAIAGGLAAGDLYRTGADPDPVMVVH